MNEYINKIKIMLNMKAFLKIITCCKVFMLLTRTRKKETQKEKKII